jgi:hypothetical protein
MKSSSFAAVACLSTAGALAAFVGSASAQDAGGRSAAERAMEAQTKAATPGPEHGALAKLKGKWALQILSWPAPDSPALKSEATGEFTPIVGGRYLQEKAQGKMGPRPFEGVGIEGFNNVTHERFRTWFDSMSTGPIVLRGKCPIEAKKCAFKGTMPDPLVSRDVEVSEILTATDEDHFTRELFAPGPSGEAFKILEIAYSRK